MENMELDGDILLQKAARDHWSGHSSMLAKNFQPLDTSCKNLNGGVGLPVDEENGPTISGAKAI